MDKIELQNRTKAFALRVIKMVGALDRSMVSDVLGKQLLRAASSVGANYRAACRGRSKAEFIAKLGIVVEEADECGYWLELIVDSGIMSEKRVEPLIDEANQLTAIFVSTIKSTRSNNQKSHVKNQKS
jgi:four helix bundle protein